MLENFFPLWLVELLFSPGLILGPGKVAGLCCLYAVVQVPCGGWYVCNNCTNVWMLCQFNKFVLVVVVDDIVMLVVGDYVKFNDVVHCGCCVGLGHCKGYLLLMLLLSK